MHLASEHLMVWHSSIRLIAWALGVLHLHFLSFFTPTPSPFQLALRFFTFIPCTRLIGLNPSSRLRLFRVAAHDTVQARCRHALASAIVRSGLFLPSCFDMAVCYR
ncbi:hypothetical protein BDP55DRAFT_645023 [Colletotrichum godetiae]|uniref:Uncharacterized protein n=1 Tax=Colletotrichum godetiae TaxID=1209918 RepID=A0AAJ0AWY5_9PEZI|nr:uncharacterized protein BDP55DRAFT_645023 [Colletotrichum godetiae]KAK1699831.1 hypothetical protein BDP55DRAFT_645023 [Colletotrichum godetiae]